MTDIDQPFTPDPSHTHMEVKIPADPVPDGTLEKVQRGMLRNLMDAHPDVVDEWIAARVAAERATGAVSDAVRGSLEDAIANELARYLGDDPGAHGDEARHMATLIHALGAQVPRPPEGWAVSTIHPSSETGGYNALLTQPHHPWGTAFGQGPTWHEALHAAIAAARGE